MAKYLHQVAKTPGLWVSENKTYFKNKIMHENHKNYFFINY